ncbi:MAG: hypothetical protein U0586_16915 [Candidatus Brocadiaceae bacterium]
MKGVESLQIVHKTLARILGQPVQMCQPAVKKGKEDGIKVCLEGQSCLWCAYHGS